MKLKKLLLVSSLFVIANNINAYDPPTMGWSSWNTYRINISDELIRSQADAMKNTGLQDAGYKYINIDDGFFGGRDKDGNLFCNSAKFPYGMKVVADYIHSLGFKAGIYSDGGDNTCGSIWDGDKLGIGVGLYGHEDKDAKLFFKDWGYDFIKIDYCGGQNLKLDEKEQYTKIRKAIDNVGRSDVRINVCRWAFPGTWVSSIGSSWRIYADITPNWSRVRDIINHNLWLGAYAVEGHFNDMDMLEIGRGLSQVEEETHFGMWCIMSSPLLIGCDMTKIPDFSLKLVSNPELIALNQDSLCIQAQVAYRTGNVNVLVKDIETLFGKKRAVAVYNSGDTDQTLNLRFSYLDLEAPVKVRDVVAREDVGVIDDIYLKVNIKAHGTRIYTMEADNRLEPTKYEAENSWIESYQELTNKETTKPKSSSLASNGMAVSFIGNGPDNYIKWNNIYSKEGGDYTLGIRYASGEKRNLTLVVNGDTTELKDLVSSGWESYSTMTVTISLNEGTNEIRLGNAISYAPDIDYIQLKKKISTNIENATEQGDSGNTTKALSDGNNMFVNSNKSAKASIIDMQGSILKNIKLKVGKNNITGLPKGVYYVKLDK